MCLDAKVALKNKYIVYMHICPEGQKYIGITSKIPEQRWKNGEGYRNSWFYRCGIKKYGWDKLRHEIIAQNLSYDEAIKLEHQLIVKYESWCPGKGYNDSLGGWAFLSETYKSY